MQARLFQQPEVALNEKQKFVMYMVVYHLVGTGLCDSTNITSLLESIEKLEKSLYQSDQAFIVMYKGLCEKHDSSYIKSLEDSWANVYSMDYSLDAESLHLIFTVLCKIDGALGMKNLLNTHILPQELLVQAFLYPCPKVIKEILAYGIDVNCKFDINDAGDHLYIPPLYAAIFSLIKYEQIDKAVEIISILLEQEGIDVNPTIYHFECKPESQDELEKRSFYLRSFLEKLHGDLAEKFPNAAQREKVAEILSRVINGEIPKVARYLNHYSG